MVKDNIKYTIECLGWTMERGREMECKNCTRYAACKEAITEIFCIVEQIEWVDITREIKWKGQGGGFLFGYYGDDCTICVTTHHGGPMKKSQHSTIPDDDIRISYSADTHKIEIKRKHVKKGKKQ